MMYTAKNIEQLISQLDHSHPNFNSLYGDVLNWIHHHVTQDVLKVELVKLAEKFNMQDYAESVPESRINVEGSIAYCLNRGAKLLESSTDRVKNFLLAFESDNDTEVDENSETSAKMRSHRALINCRTLLSQAMHQCANNTMNIRELSSYVRDTVQKYGLGKNRITKELRSDFKEFLGDARQDEVCTSWVKPLQIIVDVLDLMTANRRGKTKNFAKAIDRKGEKAAAKLSIKDEDTTLGLRSLDPTRLIGAEIAVVFNTKNRHCEVYKAKEGSKLSVAGARITNFDATASLGKVIRKPNQDLPRWTGATSIRRLEVLLNEINGKAWTLKGKINKNCVIIKVL